jgi:hypothetical protein
MFEYKVIFINKKTLSQHKRWTKFSLAAGGNHLNRQQHISVLAFLAAFQQRLCSPFRDGRHNRFQIYPTDQETYQI